VKTTEERLRESEQSRRVAWQILQEFRAVLETLGDEAIPREESQRFRREGDFILRALLNLATASRLHIYKLEQGIKAFEGTLADCDLPRDARLELAQLSLLCRGSGLSNDEINRRLDRLRELRVLPQEEAQ
jgi:hypothetical protein